MLESAQRSRIPTFRAPDNVAWFIGPRGNLLQCDGTGLDRIGGADLRGQHVAEIARDRPDLAALFNRLLAGESHRGVVEFRDVLWLVEAAPVYKDGVFLGVSGVSIALEQDRPRVPEASRVVEIAGDMPHHEVWSADRFLVKPGRNWVTQIRVRPLADLLAIESEAPERVHVIREQPSPPVSGRPPHLQLLR